MPGLLFFYSPELLVNAIMSLISLVPIPVLYRLYRRTQVIDYLLYAGVFLAFSLSVVFVSLATNTNSLIFWQLRHIMMYLTYILIFFHAIRLAWIKFPKYLTSFIVIWLVILVILTLLWKSMPNREGVVLFWEMDPHSIDSLFSLWSGEPKLPDLGAGLTINGVIILSTSHPLLAYVYYFLVACIYLYVYLTQKPASPTPRIILARRLWILVGVINFTATGLLVLWPFSMTTEVVILLVIAELALIAIVALKYPESMLLSHVQLHRAANLYEKVQAMQDNCETMQVETGMTKVIEYLRMIDMKAIEADLVERS